MKKTKRKKRERMQVSAIRAQTQGLVAELRSMREQLVEIRDLERRSQALPEASGTGALEVAAPGIETTQEAASAALDPIYTTDDYPREGCTAVIEVSSYGYGLAIFAPNGAKMESYTNVKSGAAISRMLREWCEGCVPKLRGEGD